MELISGADGQPIGPIINAAQLFWLPPDTPFGNLQLKLLKVFERLGHANLRITESHKSWNTFVQPGGPWPGSPGSLHYYTAEESVLMMRRAADELVSIVGFLEARLSADAYPTKLAIDSVGGAIHNDHILFDRHEVLLTLLNDIANAHKHSFVQTDANIIGRDEPCVVGLALHRNNTDNEAVLYVVSMDQLTRSFNAFLLDCLGHLRRLCEHLRTQP